MSIQEQKEVRENYYCEAVRYMDNAKECLIKAKKEGKYYADRKYVKMACGTAYSGVLVALDGFLITKDVEVPKGKKRKSIEFYHNHLALIDKKMLKSFNRVYEVLHLWGYNDGTVIVAVVKAGFDSAYEIIEKIKPPTLHP